MSGRHRQDQRARRGGAARRRSAGGPAAIPRSRAPGAGTLAARQFRADPWVSVGLALLIGLVALLLTAVPRGLTDVQSRQLVQEVDALSARQRDVIGTWGRFVVLPSLSLVESGEVIGMEEQEWEAQVDDPWKPFREGAQEVVATQPEPLRSVLGPAQMLARLQPEVAVRPPVETGFVGVTYSRAVDPDLEQHVDLVEGEWPGLTFDAQLRDGFPVIDERGQVAAEGLVDVVLSRDATDQLLLEVGDEVADSMVLSGVYEPKDPDDPRWQHVDNGARLGVVPDADKGDTAYATAFLSPLNRGSTGQPASVQMRLWYPVDPTTISGSTGQVEALRTQLTGFLAQQHTLATQRTVPDSDSPQIPIFDTELTGTLDRIATQQRATASLLAVVAAGPLGVALAVAALGARLVVHRRRPALAMALARGASPQQLRWLVAAEGLALGIPAAVLGHLLATALLPGPTPWWQWVVTAAVALVPPVTLAASLDDASLLEQRSDLSGRSRSRWRWVVEVAVLALAAVATWRLLDRGSRGDDAGDTGIDLLAAATPVLLALAACVAALRLYPLPLAALTRALRRRPGLTPFLGAARSLRDPAGGLVPALAVVLGTTIALVSAVLLSTVTRGAELAAWEANGAPIRVNGPSLTDDLRSRLAAVEGVSTVAGIATSSATSPLIADGERTSVRVWLVDPEVAQIHEGSPVAGLPDRLYATDGIPGIVTLRGTTVEGTPERLTLARLGQVEVVGHLAQLPGVEGSAGVAVSRERWEAAGQEASSPQTTLVDVAEDADPARVLAGVTEVMDGAGVITTVDERLDRFREAPVTQGLTQLFVGATILAGLLTVLAVVVVQLMGSGARARLLAVLRTLGLGPGQTRTLTAWELAPLLVTSILVGAVLGLAVPWVLLRGLDLTGLTGGATQPALVVDPVVVAAVLAGVVLTVVAAVIVSAWLAGRTNLAQALRVGEERAP